LLCLRNARAFPLLPAALASVPFGFVLVRVRVRFLPSTHYLLYDFDLRATHARTLLPAALASVSFGFVLVRVREVRKGGWGLAASCDPGFPKYPGIPGNLWEFPGISGIPKAISWSWEFPPPLFSTDLNSFTEYLLGNTICNNFS